jgi:hypothetical protein
MNEETLKELKNKCILMQLPTYGTKAELKSRITYATTTNNKKRKIQDENKQDDCLSKMKMEQLKAKCKQM